MIPEAKTEEISEPIIDKDRETRTTELASAIREIETVRTFELRGRFHHILRRILLDAEHLFGEENQDIIINDHSQSLLLTQTLRRASNIDMAKAISEWTSSKDERKIHLLFRVYEKSYSEPLKAFDVTHNKWRINNPKSKSIKDKKHMLLHHLASIIVGHGLDNETSHKDRMKARESIQLQVSRFINDGEVEIRRPENIDPARGEHPNAMIFLSDNRNELIWKYSRYCHMCGNRIHTCYCKPIYESVEHDDIFELRCWNCTNELILISRMMLFPIFQTIQTMRK